MSESVLKPLASAAYSHTSDMASTANAEVPSADSAETPFVKPPKPPRRSSVRHLSPESHSPRPGKRMRPSPVPMTAAAELLDRQRASKSQQATSNQTTPNPARQALSALMGLGTATTGATSAWPDAPAPSATTMSAPMSAVAENIQTQPEDRSSDTAVQTSPISLSSIGTLGSNLSPSGIDRANMESPRSIGDSAHEVEASSPAQSNALRPPATNDDHKSFTYPGPRPPPPPQHSHRMSLPGSDSRYPERSSSSSSSMKKHSCHFCGSDFTRHHNLKSHLLTHSHEKPYVCQECDLPFRRLHDLKRHTKLHTGERPHTCPKCHRSFARGDALARHTKGPGGCAGRRDSTGSFGVDEERDTRNHDPMEGIVYREPENMDDDESVAVGSAMVPPPPPPSASDRRGPPADQSAFQQRQPSTYPPIQGRPPGGLASGFYLQQGTPGGDVGGTESSTSSKPSPSGGMSYPSGPNPSSALSRGGRASVGGGPGGATGGPILPRDKITESPGPLSPGPRHGAQLESGRPFHDRSSSLSSQIHSQHQQPQQEHQYSHSSGRRTSPMAPLAAVTNIAAATASGSGQLPPPHSSSSLNPPDPRYGLAGQGPAHPPTGPTGPPTQMSGGNRSSKANSHSSSLASSLGQPSAKNSGEVSAGAPGAPAFSQDRLWAYVNTLEERINGLQSEVTSLKEQLAATNWNHNPPSR